MKKLFLTFAVALAGLSGVSAQSAGDKAFAVNLNYASETSFGIGARMQYNLTNNVRIEPEFNYYFKHDYLSFWDLGANFHYLFPVASDVVIYPLVGLGYGSFHGGGESLGRFQAKFGAGAEFNIAGNTKLFIEPKYQLIDGFNQFVLSAGLSFAF